MTNFKLSTKFRLFAIISVAVIVLGMIMGTVFHFVGNGFFSYSGEYDSYKSVTVSYYEIELGSGEDKVDILSLCDGELSKAGVTPYAKVFDNSGVSSGRLVYKFSPSTDTTVLEAVKDAINSALDEKTAAITDIRQSYAEFTEEQTILGGEHVLTMASVALATIVAAHFIYIVIRFGLAAMCTAFAVDLNSLALFAALLALCRIPVTSSAMVMATLLVLVTVIGSTLTFERIKRNRKDPDNEKLSIGEISDLSASQTAKSNLALSVFFVVIAILAVIASMIGALSATPLLAPAYCALVAFIVSFFGTAMFLPATYPVFYALASKIHFKPSLKKGK